MKTPEEFAETNNKISRAEMIRARDREILEALEPFQRTAYNGHADGLIVYIKWSDIEKLLGGK